MRNMVQSLQDSLVLVILSNLPKSKILDIHRALMIKTYTWQKVVLGFKLQSWRN